MFRLHSSTLSLIALYQGCIPTLATVPAWSQPDTQYHKETKTFLQTTDSNGKETGMKQTHILEDKKAGDKTAIRLEKEMDRGHETGIVHTHAMQAVEEIGGKGERKEKHIDQNEDEEGNVLSVEESENCNSDNNHNTESSSSSSSASSYDEIPLTDNHHNQNESLSTNDNDIVNYHPINPSTNVQNFDLNNDDFLTLSTPNHNVGSAYDASEALSMDLVVDSVANWISQLRQYGDRAVGSFSVGDSNPTWQDIVNDVYQDLQDIRNESEGHGHDVHQNAEKAVEAAVTDAREVAAGAAEAATNAVVNTRVAVSDSVDAAMALFNDYVNDLQLSSMMADNNVNNQGTQGPGTTQAGINSAFDTFAESLAFMNQGPILNSAEVYDHGRNFVDRAGERVREIFNPSDRLTSVNTVDTNAEGVSQIQSPKGGKKTLSNSPKNSNMSPTNSKYRCIGCQKKNLKIDSPSSESGDIITNASTTPSSSSSSSAPHTPSGSVNSNREQIIRDKINYLVHPSASGSMNNNSKKGVATADIFSGKNKSFMNKNGKGVYTDVDLKGSKNKKSQNNLNSNEMSLAQRSDERIISIPAAQWNRQQKLNQLKQKLSDLSQLKLLNKQTSGTATANSINSNTNINTNTNSKGLDHQISKTDQTIKRWENMVNKKGQKKAKQEKIRRGNGNLAHEDFRGVAGDLGLVGEETY